MIVSHRALIVVVAALAAASLVGMALLWPPGDAVDAGADADAAPPDDELIDATIVDVEPVGDVDDPGLPPGARSVIVIAERADTGEIVVFPMVDDTGELYQPGVEVMLQQIEDADGEATYLIADFQRGPAMIALAGMFALAVLAFARWQGLRALVGLALTFLVIIGFMVPAILAGRSPVVVALVGSVAIMIVTLYLAHGFSAKTTAAVVGTTGALAATVALATFFVDATALTGLASEDARLANVEVGGISLRGLMLAGIIIGTLGVLDDVTMSQASTVFALRRADPAAGFGRLFGGALTVGRDHLAATVNTLFLVYAGAALPLLILFVTGPAGLGEALTMEIVAVEVVRTLVGSIGLIAAVPITTALAAGLARGDPRAAAEAGTEEAAPSDGQGEGARAERDGSGGDTAPDESEPPGSDADAAPGARWTASASAATGTAAAPATDDSEADADTDTDWEARLRQAYGLDEEDADQGP